MYHNPLLPPAWVSLQVIGLWCLDPPEDGFEVWLALALRPDEVETAKQGDKNQEELHACQSLTQTHTRTYTNNTHMGHTTPRHEQFLV